MFGFFKRSFIPTGTSTDRSVIGNYLYKSQITIGDTAPEIIRAFNLHQDNLLISELRDEIINYRFHIKNYDDDKDTLSYMLKGQSMNGVHLGLLKIYDELAIRQLKLGSALIHKIQKENAIDNNSLPDLEEAHSHLENVIKLWSITPESPFGSIAYQSDLNISIAHSYLGWSFFSRGMINNDMSLIEKSIQSHKDSIKTVKVNQDYKEWMELNTRLGGALLSAGIIKKDKSNILEAENIFKICLSQAKELYDRNAISVLSHLLAKCKI